jgi:diaminohydroxyphosphoribosylaminopyrimidine deaminase / 5-amino-6-(5-phosphoribosylamino)uracil reductase
MHEQWLRVALEQAWLGRGVTAPNPAVGAVAVLNEISIAHASHAGVGHAHAEQVLFEALPDDCSDLTLYVTLEPCNHWGRTPPCTDGIIARKFKQVVYGYTDPNPQVQCNNTPAILREHGIEVLHYPLPEIDAFYESYAFWIRTARPWVTVKIAQSLDGKIAGKGGERVHLSNNVCSVFTHQARLHTDVILTTAKTIKQDDPCLNARVKGEVVTKPVAILDRAGCLELSAQVHQTAQKLHVYHDDVHVVLDDLGRLGYHDVWVEAGANLFRTLHREGLVQRTHVYVTPHVLGDDAVSLYDAGGVFLSAKKTTWKTMGDNVHMILDW